MNISRQRLQQDRHITQIRKWLTRKVLAALTEIQKTEPETYLKFWGEFGRALKEGVSSDYENKEKLLIGVHAQHSHRSAVTHFNRQQS